MNNLIAIQRKLDKLKEEVKRVRVEQREAIRHSFIKCTKCGKQSRLFSWNFIQDQYYVAPHSCTGGDYWSNSKTECCYIVCPKCGSEIYIYNHPQKDKITDLVDSYNFSKSDLFKEVRNGTRKGSSYY